MIKNPEFVKNVQLELNPVKLALMPVILGMVFFVIYLMYAEVKAPIAYSMQVASLVLFAIIVFIWGTKMAIESLVNEFNDKTWDSQRMTAIGPWTLAWGKLFGSTLFAWYGGLFCLLLFTLSSFATAESQQHLIEMLFIIIFTGLLTQTVILSFILTGFAKNRESVKLNISSYSLAAIFFFLQFMSFAISAYNTDKDVQWYGNHLHPLDIALASSVLFCLWGTVGLYRAMRKELQFENSPWVWTAFVVNLMVYFASFVPMDQATAVLSSCFYVAFLAGVVTFYITLFAEPKNSVELRLAMDRARRKEFTALATKIPAWFISLLLAAITCSILFLIKGIADLQGNSEPFFLDVSPLALFLFCLRDLGIVLCVNLNSVKKNREVTAAFYLAVLYLLIPLLLKIAGAEIVLPWLLPVATTSFSNATVPIAVQAGTALYFAGKQLR
jgi:hypothetical protein